MKLARTFALSLCLLPSFGCSSCSKDDKAAASGGSVPSSEAGAGEGMAVPVADAASPRAVLCHVKVPTFLVDRGVRAETGVSVTTWSREVAIRAATDAGPAMADGGDAPDAAPASAAVDAGAPGVSDTGARIVLGYAKGNGKPFVAELTEEGGSRIVPVTSTLTALDEKPGEGTRRVVQRVVPLGPTAAGAEAAVDYIETGSDKTRRVHCGPASGGPFVSTSGASLTAGAADATSETIECRTIAKGGAADGPTALESTLTIDGTRMLAELFVGKTKVASRETPIKAGEKASDRYAFTLLGYAAQNVFSAVTARFNGNVVVVTRADRVDGADTVAQFWLGAPTNAPSPTFSGTTLIVATTLNSKPEVYLASAEPSRKGPKLEVSHPVPRPMDDGPGGVTERGAPFADGDSSTLVLMDTVGGKRVARVHMLATPSASSPLPYVFAPTEGTLVDAKVVATPNGAVVLATVTLDPKRGGVLEATVLSCP